MNEILIESRGLCKNFGALPALQNVTFTLPKGRIVGLLGPNGSGENHAVKADERAFDPHGRHADHRRHPIGVETKKIVSYLPDRNFLSPWMTVEQMCTYFADFFGILTGRGPMRCWRSCKSTKPAVQNPVERHPGKSGADPCNEPQRPALFAGRTHCRGRPGGAGFHFAHHCGQLPGGRHYFDLHPPDRRRGTGAFDVLFLQYGHIVLQDTVDAIREREKKSVDALFREVFRC